MTKLIEVKIPVYNDIRVTLELDDDHTKTDSELFDMAIADAIKNQEKVTWLIKTSELDDENLSNYITIISS